MSENNSDVALLNALHDKQEQLRQEIGKVIIGQHNAIDSLLTAIFTGGHCLLVGVPGLAKTLLVNTIAKCLGLSFNRIQFTPDLMPSDIIGSEILDESRRFSFTRGPLFANIILADEINRTPPKTQAALLEAMQEKNVTVAGKRYELDTPFFVLATQNPIEQEGTYPLPEAQLDRFMFNINLDYPTFDEELKIVKTTTTSQEQTVRAVISKEEIITFQQVIRKMPVADNVCEYAVRLVNSTRASRQSSDSIAAKYLSWGAGPRASQYLIMGAKTCAALDGRYTPDIADIRTVATEVLRHRIVRNYYAEAEGISTDAIIGRLLEQNVTVA